MCLPQDSPSNLASHGYAFTLPTNFRLNWVGLPETKTLAYYENSLITAVKSFVTFGPRHGCYDLSYNVQC